MWKKKMKSKKINQMMILKIKRIARIYKMMLSSKFKIQRIKIILSILILFQITIIIIKMKFQITNYRNKIRLIRNCYYQKKKKRKNNNLQATIKRLVIKIIFFLIKIIMFWIKHKI
ncbi:hypothetical protein IMG5_000870 [Ichthyophthirius multifiliis]|uniref:Transmembrane protein n=1 Tax=Ichthyophthirius multifiliis TaxID=5932 RepID=G0QIX4_ICHMU|nr:hypothetical protein IMG5_000870 [Ichthyophthirius multifiliis]EGR34859.1 hypothetical protein IMG5_000870 [Ichthyophthirius multifiliis]|eukprot:XP_004040163.1 hypothetical protein IMG5_000870 [Ichthyophthirius multifiliis]